MIFPLVQMYQAVKRLQIVIHIKKVKIYFEKRLTCSCKHIKIPLI